MALMKHITRLAAGALALVAGPATLAAAASPISADATGVPAAPAGVEIMLVVDTSGSMAGRPIEVAREAASSFVAQMPADVPIGVVSFGRETKVWSAPTVDRGLISFQLAGLTADGGTHLHDAIITATGAFTPAARYKAIVLLSDGGDQGSVASLDDAVRAVSGVHVEAISLTTSKTDIGALARLGTVTSADDPAALPAVLSRIAALVIPATVQAATPPPTAAPTTLPATTLPATTLPPTTTLAPTTLPATTAPEIGHPAPAAPRRTSSTAMWAGAGMVFVALFGLVLVAFPRVKVNRRRLGITEQQRSVSDAGRRATVALDDFLERRGKRGALAVALDAADIPMRPGEFAALALAVCVVTGLVGLALGGPLLAAILGGLVAFVARALVDVRSRRRRAAFAAGLTGVLQLLTSSLRSGYGMTQALDAVAEEADEPARSEFKRVVVETRLGREITESIRNLAERMRCTDLDWVASAIDIHQETGGNLAEILDTVGATIRERQRLVRQVATLTAEGRISAYVLTGLPFLMAAVLHVTNPDYFDQLTHGGGLAAVGVAGGLMVVGWVWMRRLVNIEI